MNEQQSVKSVPGFHPLTVRLIDKLKGGTVGDEIPGATLAEIIGMSTDVGMRGYGYLMSAIRHCERSHSVVWRRVRGECKILCLNAKEVMELAHSDVNGIRRRARRGSRRLYGIQMEQIPAVDRPQCSALAAQLGFIASVSTNSATKKLAGKTEQPKIAEALQLFK